MTDFGDLFGSPEPGRRRRDEGMARVAAHNKAWMVAAITVIQNLPAGWRGRPENMRWIIERTVGKPTHHNIYGHLTKRAKKLGLIRQTRRSHNVGPLSNAREVWEYERVP